LKVTKQKRLEAAGWRVAGTVQLLKLTPEEAALVEMKLNLARRLRALRSRRGLSQQDAARLFGSSQSRVAKMEAGDVTVSIDLLVRSLLTIGASRQDIAKAIARRAAIPFHREPVWSARRASRGAVTSSLAYTAVRKSTA
jgi:predicted XRE-type DNA-binding protein